MRQTEKQKEEALDANLQTVVKDFYSQADVMSCIDSLNYLAFSIDEDVDPLTSADNANMRSLMRMLIDLCRLQNTGKPYA